MELPGGFDRLLTRHRVHHKQSFVGRNGVLHRFELRHQLVINLEAAGGVNDCPRRVQFGGTLYAILGDIRCVTCLGILIDCDIYLVAQRFELLDGGGALQVGGYHHGRLSVLLQVARKLGGCGRLAGTVQADHQYDRGTPGAGFEPVRVAAQNVHKGIVGDFHHLLAGREALQHIGFQRFLADARNEVTRHAEVDVCLKQRHTHFSQRGVHILLGQPAFVSKATEYAVQLLRQSLEHFSSFTNMYSRFRGNEKQASRTTDRPAH